MDAFWLVLEVATISRPLRDGGLIDRQTRLDLLTSGPRFQRTRPLGSVLLNGGWVPSYRHAQPRPGLGGLGGLVPGLGVMQPPPGQGADLGFGFDGWPKLFLEGGGRFEGLFRALQRSQEQQQASI